MCLRVCVNLNFLIIGFKKLYLQKVLYKYFQTKHKLNKSG